MIDRRIRLLSLSVAAGFVLSLVTIGAGFAQSGGAGASSGLPLPRFVSLKSNRVNMRVGPGREFRVEWMYLRPGLPMEVIQEYDNWRKVRDPDGNEGWILHSLLAGKRTAIIAPWDASDRSKRAPVYGEPDGNARRLAELEPGVVAEVSQCDERWCEISVADVSGFVEKKAIWGVYPDELIED